MHYNNKKCTHCGSEELVETKLQRGFSYTHGFSLEPLGKHWTRRGVWPDVYVCSECKHIMFFLTDKNFEKILKK